eukprot:92632-Amphidinium_carterae.1
MHLKPASSSPPKGAGHSSTMVGGTCALPMFTGTLIAPQLCQDGVTCICSYLLMAVSSRKIGHVSKTSVTSVCSLAADAKGVRVKAECSMRFTWSTSSAQFAPTH